MDRRAFLGSILKVAAATALPSEIWPFRKIFLPAQRFHTIDQDPFFDFPHVQELYDIYAIEAGIRHKQTLFTIPSDQIRIFAPIEPR